MLGVLLRTFQLHIILDVIGGSVLRGLTSQFHRFHTDIPQLSLLPFTKILFITMLPIIFVELTHCPFLTIITLIILLIRNKNTFD